MGLIFLLAVVLAGAFYWWQSGMVPFWDGFGGRDSFDRPRTMTPTVRP